VGGGNTAIRPKPKLKGFCGEIILGKIGQRAGRGRLGREKKKGQKGREWLTIVSTPQIKTGNN